MANSKSTTSRRRKTNKQAAGNALTPAKQWPATIPAKLRRRLIRDQVQFLRRSAEELGTYETAFGWLCDGTMMVGDVQRPGYHVTLRIVNDALWQVMEKTVSAHLVPRRSDSGGRSMSRRNRPALAFPKPKGAIDKARPAEQLNDPLPPAERRILQHIADHADLIDVEGPTPCGSVEAVWLLVWLPPVMLDQLSQFEAWSADLEPDSDREPETDDDDRPDDEPNVDDEPDTDTEPLPGCAVTAEQRARYRANHPYIGTVSGCRSGGASHEAQNSRRSAVVGHGAEDTARGLRRTL